MALAVLVGCTGTGTVTDASDKTNMRRIIGTDLIGARGATEADQDKINTTVVRLGRTAIYTPAELAAHGQAIASPSGPN